MTIKNAKFFVFMVLSIAALLRLWNLGNYPPLNADEAAIGYNAYSILETGRDEHGDFLPLHFKSFGDYKPGLYFYLAMPFVKILGLNEWAVRLPSALLGIATVYLVYLLAKLLWNNETFGIIWAFILTISPWHIHFSRGGWESNTALFFILFGVYLFYKLKVNPPAGGEESRVKLRIKSFWIVLLPFIFSLYTYHSARIIAPVLFLGLVVFNWKFVWKNKKQFLITGFVGFLLLIPLVFSFLKGGAGTRFSGVGIFADTGPLWRVNELINHHQLKGFPFFRIIHNKIVIYAISFFQKYFSHFDGDFLFISGDSVPRSKLPEMGVMHLIEAPFLILGIWLWLRSKKDHNYLPFLWLLVAPIASALTFQAPSALRALSMVIPLTFFVSYGILKILKLLSMNYELINEKKRGCFNFILHTSYFILIWFYGWSFLYWKDAYFNHYLKRYPSAWPDFKPIAEQLIKEKDSGQKVCIETNVDQPYILTLFYLKYPPEKIQKEIKLTPPDKFGFSTVKNFGKYQFGDCEGFDGKIIQS